MFFSFKRTHHSLWRSSQDLRRNSEAFQPRPGRIIKFENLSNIYESKFGKTFGQINYVVCSGKWERKGKRTFSKKSVIWRESHVGINISNHTLLFSKTIQLPTASMKYNTESTWNLWWTGVLKRGWGNMLVIAACFTIQIQNYVLLYYTRDHTN